MSRKTSSAIDFATYGLEDARKGLNGTTETIPLMTEQARPVAKQTKQTVDWQQEGPLCQACGEHQTSAIGSLSVSNCYCKAGYFKEESQCVACGLGFFRTVTDSEQSCVACHAGLTTLQNASNSSEMCVACANGHFISESGECRPCPAHASSVAVGQCQCNAGDDPFIVLTETKFSFRCIPVWIGTLLTGLGSKKKHM
jgi:hypothetical protein